MAIISVLCGLMFFSCICGNLAQALNLTETPRQARRSSVLADSCLTNAGNSGTCMTRFKCMRQSGTANGFCGTYGVCCETNMQCGQTSRLKRTIIRNPPSFTVDLCQYTIEAYSPNVRQLRIDFEVFELQQPTPDPTDDTIYDCTDYLTVGNFRLCGVNSGQHLYVPFNAGAGIETLTLAFNLPTRWASTNWRLVITQLEEFPVRRKSTNAISAFGATTNNLQDWRNIFASHHGDSDLLAPAGCDQYYTELTGNIRSFNFLAQGGIYLPDMRYTICIRATQGANMIEYNFNRFSLATQSGVAAPAYDEVCHATVHTQFRVEDYLMIPKSVLVSNNMPSDFQPTYYCGLNDNMIVWANPPFIMNFASDERVFDATQETGFSLTYRLRNSMF